MHLKVYACILKLVGEKPFSCTARILRLVSENFLCSAFYRNMIEISKRVTCNQIVGIFGFVGEDHIGKYSFPPVQV